MNRTATILALCLVAMSAQAEGTRWVQAKAAYIKPDGCNCLKDTFGFGLGAGRWINPRWGFEVDLLRTTLQSREGGIKANENQLLGSALYGLGPDGLKWKPYLRVGIGWAQVQSPFSLGPDTTLRFGYHGGVGTQFTWREHGFGSLELRSVTISTMKQRTEYQGVLGLGYRWQTSKSAPIPPSRPVIAPVPPPPPAITPSPAPTPTPAVIPAPMPPPPIPVAAPLPPPVVEPKAEPLPSKIILDQALLHFANNRDELAEDAKAAIRKVALSLKAYPGTYILTVSGHTSSLGDPAWNKALSKRRAEAVAAILVAEGLPIERVRTVGKGAEQPLTSNTSKEGQARNRRVEIDVEGTGLEVRKTESSLQEAPTQKPAKPIKTPKKASKL